MMKEITINTMFLMEKFTISYDYYLYLKIN